MTWGPVEFNNVSCVCRECFQPMQYAGRQHASLAVGKQRVGTHQDAVGTSMVLEVFPAGRDSRFNAGVQLLPFGLRASLLFVNRCSLQRGLAA